MAITSEFEHYAKLWIPLVTRLGGGQVDGIEGWRSALAQGASVCKASSTCRSALPNGLS